MKEKVRNFFLTNSLLKRVRGFFRNVFLPILIKTLLALITALILIILTLKLFKPEYIDKINKRAGFYFFHYLNLDNYDLGQVSVVGNKYVSEDQVTDIVRKAQIEVTRKNKEDYQPLIAIVAKEIKSKLPWVQNVVVTRAMPNSLNIVISEYVPIAIWQNDGEKFLTDKEGNLIPFEDLDEFKDMVVLSGHNANFNAKSLINIFAADPELSSQVYSATWVSNRRWDIRFENGLLIKLPEKNISQAWNRLIKIYNTPGSILGLKIIDLRISDKVYLEYDDSVIKELKNL